MEKMDNLLLSRKRARLIIQVSQWATILAVIIFALVYWYQPLPGDWNDHIYYAFVLSASWLAAILGTLVCRQFSAGEPPRRPWILFDLGLWSWALAELAWIIIRPLYEEMPGVSFIDGLWVAGYLFFVLSLYYQHRLIYVSEHSKEQQTAEQRWLLFIAVLILGATLLIARLADNLGYGQDWSPLGMYLVILYPVGDLIIVLAGINLTRLFGRGLWGRAFWGLLAFAFSDGITSWYYLGGSAMLTEHSDAVLSLITDVLYFGAYVLFAFAGLGQYLLLRYGPPSDASTDERLLALADESSILEG